MTLDKSNARSTVANVGLVLVTIGFVSLLVPTVSATVPPGRHINNVQSLLIVAVVSITLLCGLARYLRARSLLSQIPLQALAISFLAVGVRGVISQAFDDWRQILNASGVVCLAYIGLGAICGIGMGKLQRRFLP